jgi:hypothetical protein
MAYFKYVYILKLLKFSTCHVLLTALPVLHSSLVESLAKRDSLIMREEGYCLFHPGTGLDALRENHENPQSG